MSAFSQFFDETTEQSAIKAKIVSDYFWAWAKVITPTAKKIPRNRIAYFELSHPLDDLESVLPKNFAGHSLSLQTIYEEHYVGKPYILNNYRDALRRLEHKGKIRTEPPAERRPKIRGEVTFTQKVRVTLPGST